MMTTDQDTWPALVQTIDDAFDYAEEYAQHADNVSWLAESLSKRFLGQGGTVGQVRRHIVAQESSRVIQRRMSTHNNNR